MLDKKFALTVCAAMVGCASPYMWTKHGSTQDNYNQDLARCRYEAAAATAGYNTGRVAPTMGGAIAQGLGDGMAIGIRRSELIELCLQARGYTKILISSAALPPLPTPPPIAAAAQPKQPADAEMEKVAQVLADQRFPLAGDPVRFKSVDGRTYYEARGNGGRLTQVICQSGECRLRTIYD